MDELSIDGLHWSTFTRLRADEITALRERARRDGGLVDPRLLRSHSQRMEAAPRRWAHAILGRPYRGTRVDTWTAFLTLAYALDVEPEPPVDPIRTALAEQHHQQQQQQRIEQQQQQEQAAAAWAALRAKLPVPVRVLYNYSGGLHLESYSSGADHIVLDADLHAGRITRAANTALCSTPSALRRQVFAHETRFANDDTRLPTCRACLRTAVRVGGAAESTAADAELLATRSRRARTIRS